MKIKLITIGKIKEKYFIDAIKEYSKRLQGYTKLELIEVKDESIPDKCSLKLGENIKEIEGEKVLSKIKDDEYVIVLELAGKMFDSVQFSQHIEDVMVRGFSTITFVIGGSLGNGVNVLQRANLQISFSKMTFTHQMIKVFALEQIYRAFKIMKNENYHK